jgi:hypothetical protein
MSDQLGILPLLMFAGAVIVFGPMVILLLLIARTATLEPPGRQPPGEPETAWRMAPSGPTAARTLIDTGDRTTTEGQRDQPEQRHRRYAPFGDRRG